MNKKTNVSVLIIMVLFIGFLCLFFTSKGNNIECSYKIDYDDYSIKYTDKFYYKTNILTSIKHSVTYKFNKNSIKDTTQIYNQLLNNYQNYNDITLSSELSNKKIKFSFEFDLDVTLENRYDEFIGFKKDFIINSYKDDLINRYTEDYNNSVCKMVK